MAPTLILVAGAWEASSMEEWRAYTAARACENAVYLAAANRVGEEPSYSFGGGSVLVGPRGRRHTVLDEAVEGTPWPPWTWMRSGGSGRNRNCFSAGSRRHTARWCANTSLGRETMHIIDLRSDTITKPTPEMRRAMAEAEVGDDVFGEDPTVNRLEEMAAGRLGKEAALFVASGTMGNLVSLLAQCGRGDEIILGDQAHTYINEQGGVAAVGRHPSSSRPQRARRHPGPGTGRGCHPVRQRALSAYEAGDRREHAQPLQWRPPDARLHARPRSAGESSMACACTSTARGSSTPRWPSEWT